MASDSKPDQRLAYTRRLLLSQHRSVRRGRQSGVLGGNPDREDRKVQDREYQGIDGQSKRQRDHRNLANDDGVVGMPQKPVWAPRHKVLSWYRNNADRPAATECQQNPKTACLQADEDYQKKRFDRPVVSQHPQTDEPRGMDQNHQRKVQPAMLDSASSKQPRFVLPCPPQLGQPLNCEVHEECRTPAEAHPRSTTTK